MSRIYELRLMTRVAQLYYANRLKQSEISTRLNISQATISRLLKRAEQEGIVRVTITPPRGTFPDLEQALRDRYGLTEVVVADCFQEAEDQILRAIGEAAGHYFESTIGDDEVIGLSSWSASLLAMVEAIHPLKRAKAKKVVQLLGGIGNPVVQSHATQLTTRLAALTGAEPMLLSAQGVAASAAAKLIMVGDAYVRATMEQFRHITVALVGIGALQPSLMLWNSGNSFSSDELHDLEARGAIGDVCLRFFDAAGRPVTGSLDERVIGMSLAELGKVPRVVGVAGGARKLDAIRGALLGRIVNVLITDKFTAARLTDQDIS
ncbi:sugar-binding transcriptional regulator [Oryzibacter oryziterrae]|uniref:sugar-binding transcriptional regulator n=1 Tax=Oryzibacter oryziterrae TaxID=2766474 RepID=UPI001F32787C|nr:sugar-binding transcriptional regulator [Oryzibacter oryziterrae]